jgi:hypothetical protein
MGGYVVSQQGQTVIVQTGESTSGLAIAGLIFAILGWFTCGLLCLPGAFLSGLALFAKGPKGMAIAGLIVGFPGTLFFIFFGMTMMLGALGLGAAATTAATTAAVTPFPTPSTTATTSKPSVDPQTLEFPKVEERDYTTEETTSPAPVDQQAEPMPTVEPVVPIEPTPTPEPTIVETTTPEERQLEEARAKFSWRTWSDRSGKFKTEARLVSSNSTKVTVEKRDGKIIEVARDKLSDEDQQYLKRPD